MKKILSVFMFLIVAFFATSCTRRSVYDDFHRIYLGNVFSTESTMQLYAPGKSKEQVEEVTTNVIKLLDDLDKLFNTVNRPHNPYETELMKVNNQAGIAPVKVSDEVIFVLKESVKAAKLSERDGVALFDPTISPVWTLWDFVNNQFKLVQEVVEIPTKEDIHAKLALADYKNMVIDEENHTVFLKEKGMALDLGAVVKGYAADKVKEYLTLQGYTKAIIDIGGNIQLLGSFIDEKKKDIPWEVSIRTPYDDSFDSTQSTIGEFTSIDETIVTSGVYEKFILGTDGVEYHHILDPRTGYPFENNVVSITIVTKSSITADALSTTVFAIGFEEGMKYVNQMDGFECIFVIKNGTRYEVYVSDGMYDRFVFNEALKEVNYIYKGKMVK